MSTSAIIGISVYLVLSLWLALLIWNEQPSGEGSEAAYTLAVIFFPSLLFLLFYWLWKKMAQFVAWMLRLNYLMVRAKKDRKTQTLNEAT